MRLEQEIIDHALKLGFATTGIAKAGPSETMEIFNKWIASGNSAGMNYLSRNLDLRADPRNAVPGIKSVIVTAARYPANKQPGKGFSCFARNTDYHTVITTKLTKLAEFIAGKTPATITRACVDSFPILEREWAIRAGIGWRGKQGQIVNPSHGCCILLGILLTDAELSPSGQIAQQCGNCALCVKACPTGAIQSDGTIDARKCLSYLTIEHKEDIPSDIQPLMGEALFGCDFCTAVCPKNPENDTNIMPELRGKEMPDPDQCLAMTQEQFKTRFKNTAVFRTGLVRMQRNAKIAIHNKRACR